MRGPGGLTAKQRQEFFGAVMTGCKLSHAAALAGIDLRRVQYWVTRAGAERPPKACVEFKRDYEDARNKGIAYLTRDLRRVAKTDGRSAQWMLARMDAGWRDPDKVEARATARPFEAAQLRRLEAEADLMEARAAAARALTQQGGAGLLLLAEDLDLPPALAEAVKAHLASRGIAVLPRVDLVGDVSDDDVAAASPTPMGGDS